jgi:cell division inhibitor SepF
MAGASALRKGLIWAGLADDGQSELANVEQYDGPREYVAPQPQAAVAVAPGYAEVTPIRAAHSYQAVAQSVQPDLRRITTIHPRSYNDARLIGEAFRAGTPVIMNLSDMSDDDAKRLVDFSSGLIFGLHGGIERVTGKVFLLSPEHIEVVGEEEIEAGEPAGGQFYNQS